MSNLLERLNACMTNGTIDRALAVEVSEEIVELRKRRDELEMVLLVLVRTGWPWHDDGEPNGILPLCRDGYAPSMLKARELLGLDHLSAITRTEPRT